MINKPRQCFLNCYGKGTTSSVEKLPNLSQISFIVLYGCQTSAQVVFYEKWLWLFFDIVKQFELVLIL